MLFALTLFAGVLRFSLLSRPTIWWDEAATYGRVCGSFQDLLGALQHDGFTPLHYELYWLIGRCVKLTPFVMRFVPALAGTLIVPAMYFLARQMVSKQTALLAAAIAACSGLLLAYSRDAKMYSHFWLMCTLNVACLLWWLRCRQRVAWLAWIASGVAMIGLHMPGFVLLGIETLFLFTRSRAGDGDEFAPPRRTQIVLNEVTIVLLFLIGAMLIGSGGAVHYFRFSRWSKPDTREGEEWFALQWIESYNAGRDGADMLAHVATYFVAGYAWPSSVEQPAIPRCDSSDGIYRDYSCDFCVADTRRNRLAATLARRRKWRRRRPRAALACHFLADLLDRHSRVWILLRHR